MTDEEQPKRPGRKEDEEEPKSCGATWFIIGAVVGILAVTAAVLAVILVRGDNDSGSTNQINNPGTSPTTASPVASPTTSSPVDSPTASPVAAPVPSPVSGPTAAPVPTSSPTTGPTGTPTMAPTGTPTVTPTMSAAQLQAQYEEELKDLWTSNGVDSDSESALLATSFIAQELVDGDSLDPSDETKLIQRYSLLCLDYALSGASSSGTASTGGSSNIMAYAYDGMEGPFTRHLEATFATMGEDECEWDGIVCVDGQVTKVKWGSAGLVGSIPTEIAYLAELQHLDLSSNDLVGSIPEGLWELESLVKVYLYHNSLTGTLSESMANPANLTHVHLSHNELTGSIPSALRSISFIREFYYINFSSNQLTGTIPSSLRWRKLFYLDLGWNQLTGTLPVDLGEKFVSLRHLHLDHNQFTGTLPESYLNVGNGRLEQLSIEDNQLTGAIPDGHEIWNHLVMFTMEDNDFDDFSKKTCNLAVGLGGENVELKADCDLCSCTSEWSCTNCN
eukprot:Nitzschia sp. Nitz4//scaffold63_size106090//82851//84457//NITZ4_004407-RA/size106090-augustus-gene-0.165-mRNA-1//-1//CDS//3329556026//2431//frame0